MTLQIEVSKVSVTDAGSQFSGKLLNITVNLKCWIEGVDKEVVDPVIDQDFTEAYKIIEGLSIIQSLTITFTFIKMMMQEVIDKYKREQLLLSNSSLDSVVTALGTQLVG